ncbi:MAG: hypothetical protein EBS16_10020, partial [Betaproteobacteria bacterium]|nr:hypothetical protein [Betaproteobacteria bacterium]
MTGYASVVVSDPGLALELRSVNGRFLDLSFKVADELRHLEPALREALTAAFKRGKIEVRLAVQRDRHRDADAPSPDQLRQLAALQAVVHGELPQAPALSVAEILHWCRQAPAAGDSDAATSGLSEGARAAFAQGIAALEESRAREGQKLVVMLLDRIGQLRTLAAQAAPLIPAVVQRQQTRFLERWHEALAHTGEKHGDVLSANEAFYAAINRLMSGSADGMDAVWSHGADVSDFGPDGNLYIATG